MPAIVSIGSFAAGSTPVYSGQLVDSTNNGLSYSALTTLTLSIVDTLTGLVINGVNKVNILNAGRGQVDAQGNLTITLLAGDTTMTDVPGASRVERSMVIDWTYNGGASVGRHQVNFILLALAGC